MAEFNPDQYLAEKLGNQNQGFDPDAYLAEKTGQPAQAPWYQIENPNLKGYVKGALQSLPVAGGLIGGALATPETLGVGTIPGAAAGAAAGKSLQTIGEKYLLGEDVDRTKLYAGPAKEAAEMAAAEIGGQAISKGAGLLAETGLGKKAIGLVGKGAAKVGEALTGVSEKEIQTYAKNADQIKAMAKSSDNNTAEAADQIRKQFADSIDATRKSMNDEIASALAKSDKTIEVKEIKNAINEAKSKINAKLYPEEIKQIDDLWKKVDSLSENGKLSLSDAHDVKRFLQDQASSAYRSPGQPLSLGTEAAKAAKSGAAVARKAINEAEPAIAKANNRLADLHDIEDKMNLNLIREGKPEAGLIAAGSGGNLRNAQNLKELGLLTGSDMQGQAENLAAMRTFGSPKLMAADVTGKAAGRMGAAALAGYAIGHVPGAALATALTSPAALRAAIDAGKISADALKDPNIQRIISRGLLGAVDAE